MKNFLPALMSVISILVCVDLQTAAQPREGQALQREAKNGIYVIAHRGAHQGIPENSLPAYQKAIELGCDFVEIDVRTTKDGQFISMHSATIDQYVSGKTGKVSEMNFDEIQKLDIGIRVGEKWKGTQVPAFEEILQLCKGKIGIYLDLKDAPVPDLVRLLKKYKMERDVVWYIPATYLKEIKELQTICPDCIPMVDPGSESRMDEVFSQIKTPAVATDMGELTSNFVEKAHRNKAIVFVDEKEGTEAEWSRIVEWKTDGIQTDRPEELIQFLKNQKHKK
ncbi:MAG: glycerophosphodiester phosphodiesterase family protein [Prolixibacteraceae bacterium]|nr:glycerophosphodiester phosphodiesterase family protein [Prolixibacteraceae bacterium]